MANYCERICQTVANDAAAGDTAWSNVANAKNSDGTFADVTLAAGDESQYLKFTDYAFDEGPDPVPDDATIVGVCVIPQMHQDPGDSHNNTTVPEIKLVIGGSIVGTSRHTGAPIDQGAVTQYTDFGTRSGTYNVPLDLWGNTITAADVRAATFGVALRVGNTDGSANATIKVQAVRLRVYWQKDPEVVIRKNAPVLMAPCVLGVDLAQSPVGARDPVKCQFRHLVTCSDGTWNPTQTDLRSFAGLAVRHEATSKIGKFAAWCATKAGTYDYRGRIYGDGKPRTPIADGTDVWTVIADNRTARYVDPDVVGGSANGTSWANAYASIVDAFAGEESGGAVSDIKFIVRAASHESFNNVTISSDISNVWITAEAGDPFEWEAAGTGGGLYFDGSIDSFYVEGMILIGDQSKVNQRCLSFATQNTNMAIRPAGIRGTTLPIELGAAGPDSLSRYIYIDNLTDSIDKSVQTYVIFSASTSCIELLGMNTEAAATSGANGHIRTGGPSHSAQYTDTWTGFGWSMRWSKWDSSAADFGGVRWPGNWHSTIQECCCIASGVGLDPNASGTLYGGYGNQVVACELGSKQTISGCHVAYVNCHFDGTGNSINVLYPSEQIFILNANFLQETPGAFEGIIRHYIYANTKSSGFTKQVFFENVLTYCDNPPAGSWLRSYSDRSQSQVNLVRLPGHFLNCAWPEDQTFGTPFEWWDTTAKLGPFAGGSPNFSDQAFVTANVAESASTTTIVAATGYTPDSSLTGIRGGGVPIDGVYEDITGTQRDPDAASWYIGARSADAASYYEEGSSGYIAGALSEDAHNSTSVTLSWTASSGGTAPVVEQLQINDGSWSDVSGETSSPGNATGLSPSTTYQFRVRYTDNASSVIYSNVVSVTTGAVPPEVRVFNVGGLSIGVLT